MPSPFGYDQISGSTLLTLDGPSHDHCHSCNTFDVGHRTHRRCVVTTKRGRRTGYWRRVRRRRYGRLHDQSRNFKFVDPRNRNHCCSLHGHKPDPGNLGRWRPIGSTLNYRSASRVDDGSSESTVGSGGSHTTTTTKFAIAVNKMYSFSRAYARGGPRAA